MAFYRDLPNPEIASTSRQVAESLRLLPVPWLVHDPASGLKSHEEYWRATAFEREANEQQLRTLPKEWAQQDAVPRLPLYEAQQAPLYYWLASAVYWQIKYLDLRSQIWILRFLTLLTASTVIPIGFAVAKNVFSDDNKAVGVTLIITCLPQLFLVACRISNDALAIALASLCILLALRLSEAPSKNRPVILLGLVLGLALLTKAYLLALLPLALTPYLYRWTKTTRPFGHAHRLVITTLIICFVTCGWWYARTLYTTGSLTGEQTEVAALRTHLSIATAAAQVQWVRVFDFIATSYIWLGNWSFLVVRSWMYRIVEIVFVLGAGGLAWRLALHSTRTARLVVIAMPLLTLLLGLFYQAITSQTATGKAGTMGYYLYCLVIVEMILLVEGLTGLLPYRLELTAVPFLTFTFLGIELFGTVCLLLPYYTGLIGHDANGSLRAFKVLNLTYSDVTIVLGRLLVGKPDAITYAVLVATFILFIGAAILLVYLSCFLAMCSVKSRRSWVRN